MTSFKNMFEAKFIHYIVFNSYNILCTTKIGGNNLKNFVKSTSNWFTIFIVGSEYSKQDRIVESKTYDALQLQFWSLLQGFCNNPTDLKTVNY